MNSFTVSGGQKFLYRNELTNFRLTVDGYSKLRGNKLKERTTNESGRRLIEKTHTEKEIHLTPKEFPSSCKIRISECH